MFFVNIKKIYEFKTNDKNVNLSNQFCLGSTFNKFDYVQTEVSVTENVYDFSVDYDAIDKSDILNILKYFSA